MIDLMTDFPDNFRLHRRFPELTDITYAINRHEAMQLATPAIRDNMLRASLLFTVCFYGNLLSAAQFALRALSPSHPFAVEVDTTSAHLWLELAGGELATDKPRSKRARFSPHYAPMLEATQEAGIDTRPLEWFADSLRGWVPKFCTTLGFGPTLTRYRCHQAGFGPEVTRFLGFSAWCTKRFIDCSATIAWREWTLWPNFQQMKDNLPTEELFDRVREFFDTHVELDSGGHSGLMKEAMSQVRNVDRAIDTMIRYGQFRYDVYTACLRPEPLW